MVEVLNAHPELYTGADNLLDRMPPKKAEAPKERVILGRPTNHVKAGVVGLPNVGKSTTFNLSLIHI